MDKKEELIKQLSFSLIDCPSDRWDEGYNSALKYVMNFVQQSDEAEITDEQAWNKIAEAYPESVQSLRNTLDNAVFSHKDEPKKVIVPKFVAEWIEEHCYMGKYVCLETFMCQYNDVDLPTELYNYYDNNRDNARDKVISAILNGYEIEKEPLYYVKMPKTDLFLNLNKLTGDISFVRFKLEADESGHIKLTESDIPNEYVQFAAKVED